MKHNRIDVARRDFLKVGSLALASAAIVGGSRHAAAADAAKVDEKDPTAQSLGYKQDATKVDKAKFPKYAAGQACGNCQLFQGKAGAADGPCPIFSSKLVSSKGWCSAYVKKA